MKLDSGTIIERYVVEEILGAGGTAMVYLVRHRALGTRHALKVLTLSSSAIRERMLREGQVQAALKHPNVVAVTDVVDIDGPPGYAAIADHWQALLDVSLGLVHTGTGGAHIYVTADPRSRNGASRWGAGVDTRALGGYVIAPPSVHPNGRLYTWTRPLSVEAAA